MSTSGYVVAFGGGVISFLSPCVLPLVPAYLSLTAGVGLSDRRSDSLTPAGPVSPAPSVPGPEVRDDRGSAGALRAGGLFVAGFSVVFVLLGLSATALGSLLLSEHVPVTRLAGLAVLALALTMLVTAVPIRRFIDREFRFHPRLNRYGMWAAPVAGAAFAFGWTPCIGPVLGSVLAVAADQHRLGQGALLLATYAAGLAVPFLVAALAVQRSLVAFRFARRHSVLLLRGSAAVLAGYGLLLALAQLSGVTVQLQRGVSALGLGQLLGLG